MEGSPFLGQLEEDDEYVVVDDPTETRQSTEAPPTAESTWSAPSVAPPTAVLESTWSGTPPEPTVVGSTLTLTSADPAELPEVPDASPVALNPSDSWLMPEEPVDTSPPSLTSGPTVAEPEIIAHEQPNRAVAATKEMSDPRTIHIYFGKATGLRNVEIFGSMNPYITIMMDKLFVASEPIKGGGNEPEFNAHFAMHYHGEPHCWINVMGEKKLGVKGIKGDASGWAKLGLDKELRTSTLQRVKLNLQYKKGAAAGSVDVAFRFSDQPVERSTVTSYDPSGDMMS